MCSCCCCCCCHCCYFFPRDLCVCMCRHLGHGCGVLLHVVLLLTAAIVIMIFVCSRLLLPMLLGFLHTMSMSLLMSGIMDDEPHAYTQLYSKAVNNNRITYATEVVAAIALCFIQQWSLDTNLQTNEICS
ncbi:unnamed protein product [Polarella glacialis]|uniref:Uncharacterized protein n=1 Tax=Polarella glacialis TaxID=89957 RepID=A0A813KLR7_POLGL|nr:unnamed protein product [Polarella glacialis]